MIEIANFKEVDDGTHVAMSQKRYLQLIKKEELADKLEIYLRKMEVFVMERYVENYACFGNGGVISYEDLAKMLNVDLPKVAHVGAEEYLRIKGEIENGKRETESV